MSETEAMRAARLLLKKDDTMERVESLAASERSARCVPESFRRRRLGYRVIENGKQYPLAGTRKGAWRLYRKEISQQNPTSAGTP